MKVFPNDGFSLGPIGTLISHLHTCASLSLVCVHVYVCVRAGTHWYAYVEAHHSLCV